MTRPGSLDFQDLLVSDRTLVLDGGLATELEARGHSIDTPLWSADLLLTDPQAILEVHRAFLEAGADGLISASYQLSAMGLASRGIATERLGELLQLSVDLAKRARDEFLAVKASRSFAPFVAASVGPYGAALADGSEYTGDYGVDDDTLRRFHADRLARLDASGADVLACETIPSRRETLVLAELLHDVATPAWISFSCRDGEHLNDGTKLFECAQALADHPRVLALGVNCTAPQHVSGLIRELRRAAPEKAVVVYPNSGERFDVTTRAWQGRSDPQACGASARRWRAEGATLIGGCCRVGPAHIRAMREQLDDAARSD